MYLILILCYILADGFGEYRMDIIRSMVYLDAMSTAKRVLEDKNSSDKERTLALRKLDDSMDFLRRSIEVNKKLRELRSA
jgi:hypothetical protein